MTAKPLGPPAPFFFSRREAIASLGALTLLAGCWGSFGLTTTVHSWNDKVHNSKWVKWIVFLCLVIIPVYGVALLADAVIFNTIEFFTDKNPIHSKKDLGQGHELVFDRDERTPQLVRVEHLHHGQRQALFFVRRVDEHTIMLLDENGRVLRQGLRMPTGEIRISGEGKTMTISAARLTELERTVQQSADLREATLELVRQTESTDVAEIKPALTGAF